MISVGLHCMLWMAHDRGGVYIMLWMAHDEYLVSILGYG